MRTLVKKISAAISLTFYVVGMMIVAMSIFWNMTVQLPYNASPLQGTLISLGISIVFFLYQKKLYDEDGAPAKPLVATFDSLASVVWNKFTTERKCIGKIHLVSSVVTVDQTCLYIVVGKQQIKWCRNTAEITCIDLSTGQSIFVSKRLLWKAYNHLINAFANTSKVRWD